MKQQVALMALATASTHKEPLVVLVVAVEVEVVEMMEVNAVMEGLMYPHMLQLGRPLMMLRPPRAS
jgi:hypothetical protein